MADNMRALWEAAAEELTAAIEANPAGSYGTQFAFGSLCAADGVPQEWAKPYRQRIDAALR